MLTGTAEFCMFGYPCFSGYPIILIASFYRFFVSVHLCFPWCRSDVEEGGETVFPQAKANFCSVPWWDELSECGKKVLSVKPKRGDAVLFWSMRPNATLDPTSLHGFHNSSNTLNEHLLMTYFFF